MLRFEIYYRTCKEEQQFSNVSISATGPRGWPAKGPYSCIKIMMSKRQKKKV